MEYMRVEYERNMQKMYYWLTRRSDMQRRYLGTAANFT